MKIIKIGASWCAGCKTMGPRWKEIEAENPWLQTEYHDFDQDRAIAEKYCITTIPSFIFLSGDGKELLRLGGIVDKIELIEAINKYKDK